MFAGGTTRLLPMMSRLRGPLPVTRVTLYVCFTLRSASLPSEPIWPVL